ncbi:MAG: MinD/ParA family protein [Bdellovibrionales bacterium]|nr:MinD/ParA family protein [Bdellovibrionales bacterium]
MLDRSESWNQRPIPWVRRPRVISVTSGKGGVGKTSVVANLSVTLGAKGKRVLVLDGDFGLANLDIMFDLKACGTIHDVIEGRKRLKEIILEAAPNVDVIPSASGIMGSGSMADHEKSALLQLLEEVETRYDVLMIDTGAGISDDVTWLNSSAGEVVVVATPEPTSIADAYALMKVLSQRHKVKEFNLLVNQAKSEAEGLRVFQQITAVTDRFLQVSVDYLGTILWDDHWTHAIRQRKPVVNCFPTSRTAKNFAQLADEMFRHQEKSGVHGNTQFFWRALLGHA